MREGKNMTVYTCYIINGYLFAEIDGLGRVLVDSASPKSISNKPSAIIAGIQFGFIKNFMGMTADSLSNLIGIDIDAIIGFDILDKFDIWIEIGNGKLTLSQTALTMKGNSHPLEYRFESIPVINIKIDAENFKMIFDTASKLSHLLSRIAERYEITGEDTDIFPGFGRFKTDTRKITVNFYGKDIFLTVGTYPEVVERGLEIISVHGIIGTEIFDYFNIGLSRKGKEITFLEPEE